MELTQKRYNGNDFSETYTTKSGIIVVYSRKETLRLGIRSWEEQVTLGGFSPELNHTYFVKTGKNDAPGTRFQINKGMLNTSDLELLLTLPDHVLCILGLKPSPSTKNSL